MSDAPTAVIEVIRDQPVIEIIRAGVTVQVLQQQPTVDAIDERPTLQVVREQPVVEVAAFGLRGPTGATGADGATEGTTINLIADGVVHGHRVVRVFDGEVSHPDTQIAAHALQVIGISTGSGTTGSTVTVRLKGPMTEPSWNWAPGAVWCGSDGQLTQSPDDGRWLMQVGRVLTPTSIDVDIEPAILR